jgi:hypothetical protein
MVLRQLKHRFGSLAPNLEQRIAALSLERLEHLAEALLDFRDAREIADWLNR